MASKVKNVDSTHIIPSDESSEDTVVFDLPGTLRRLGGDHSILVDLVKMFEEDSPVLLERLRTASEAHNLAQIQQVAHSLRGLASNFGAKELIQSLQELEELAATGHVGNFSALIERVRREKTRLEEDLRSYV
ncbi:MAG TPA: Hpt domain-containing protein [Pirellulales bacterium]|jgi:HPt (histidine-containing phosphotransfer) domain-containing protein|nr:Hpt domain-containing protein [Pirellulales bacterium]